MQIRLQCPTDLTHAQCFPAKSHSMQRDKENKLTKYGRSSRMSELLGFHVPVATPISRQVTAGQRTEHVSSLRTLPFVYGKSAVLQPRNKDTKQEKKHGTRLRGPRRTPRLSTSSPQASIATSRSGQQRRLVLHFDARNTVLVADTVTQIGVKEAFNSYLTGVTWGSEGDNGSWNWVSDEPSLTAPSEGCMTYYKHMEHQLVRVASDRGHLRRVSGDFAQSPLGERFLPYLETGLNAIKWTHEEKPDQLIMTDKDGCNYHYLLPALFRLFSHLQHQHRDFAVVIRTYGQDAPNILRAIDAALNGKHPDFPGLKPIPVWHNVGSIQRSKDGSITVKADFLGKESLIDERDIYQALSSVTGVSALVDDFMFWQLHGYAHTASKPHWVDLHDPSVHHILFDDNLRVTDKDSIVDLRLFPCSDSNTHAQKEKVQSVEDLEHLAHFEDACLVQADLLCSSQNQNYFVEKVVACERKYENLVLNHQH